VPGGLVIHLHPLGLYSPTLWKANTRKFAEARATANMQT
jgi:hypothetical protein